MIDLPDQHVAEFRELFRKETGKELTDDEARAYAWSLVRLVGMVAEARRAPPPPSSS